MMTYVTAFIFYTMAMIGVLLVGFVVYKKTILPNKNESRGLIEVIDSMPIGNKKVLLVVKIKNEKFLIASGVEHTTFLSKLEQDEKVSFEKHLQEEIPQIPVQKAQNKIDIDLVEDIIQENFQLKNRQQQEVRFDDIAKSHEQQLQDQFKQLYGMENIPQQQPEITPVQSIETVQEMKALKRKEALKQLIKAMNEDKNKQRGARV